MICHDFIGPLVTHDMLKWHLMTISTLDIDGRIKIQTIYNVKGADQAFETFGQKSKLFKTFKGVNCICLFFFFFNVG